MMTFTQLYTECQNQAQDTDATTSLTVIKRGINQGMQKFIAVLNRDWIDAERTFDIVANQQYYQMPEDAIRVKSLTVTVGNIVYPLEEVVDEQQWQQLNLRTNSSSFPRYFYVKGNDQYGIWPTPTGGLVGAGRLTFEASVRDMSQVDYTTGTVQMTAGSAAVVGTTTAFTANMVGRTLLLTDGSPDGIGYKIASFTDSTHITLENNYGGSNAAAATFIIGEVPNIPEEFHEALIDYAMYRYYRRRRDIATAKEMKSSFDEALALAEQNYSSKTSSQYMRPIKVRAGFTYYKRDLTIP